MRLINIPKSTITLPKTKALWEGLGHHVAVIENFSMLPTDDVVEQVNALQSMCSEKLVVLLVE